MPCFNFITFNIHGDAVLLADMAKFVSKQKRTILAIQEIPSVNEINSIPELNAVNFVQNPNGDLAFIVPKSIVIIQPNVKNSVLSEGLELRTLEIRLPLDENNVVYIVNVHGYSFSQTSDDDNKDLFHDLHREYGRIEKVVILGDFNMNPYEKNMHRKQALLAYRDFIDVMNAQKNVFYNPCWRYLKERRKNKGTFYYANSIPKWNFYDQILVSKKLAGKKNGSSTNRTYTSYIKLFHIPNSLGKKQFEPSKSYDKKNHISDHMPVLLTLEM